jgi:tetratricopeptide (TPR) repeat protein
MIRATVLASALVAAVTAGLAAQDITQEAIRQRALIPYRLGFDHMSNEAFDEAAREFQQATKTDPTFEMAHYMLGRANLARKRYVEAVAALNDARRLYRLQSGRQFSSAQDAQRFRRDTITEIDEYIRQLQNRRQTSQTIEQIRQLNERRRQLQNAVSRGNNMTLEIAVPSYVSLSLGSAYFRMGNLAEAEQAYLEAIQADPKTGEAHNNLAVVYFETGRYAEADRALRAAEKAGIRVHPDLKKQIAARVKSS